MPTFSLASIKKLYFNNKLKFLELSFLSLFLAFLPSLEAPKNIFLAGYLIAALYRQSKASSFKWTIWDWVFLSLICSSFLSALFPFMPGGSEWKGFRGILLWVAFGWTLFRTDYNFDEKKYLFIFAILMTLPPLLWGLTQLMILFTKDSLQLHSVGHVNHSAIYLCMIAGAGLSLLIGQLQSAKKKYVFITSLLFIFLISSVHFFHPHFNHGAHCIFRTVSFIHRNHWYGGEFFFKFHYGFFYQGCSVCWRIIQIKGFPN